jgi:pyruvate,water dikinase
MMPNAADCATRSIAWLGDGCHDCSLVGGKASSLCHLAAEHPVPPGFSVTAAAYEQARGEAPDGDAAVPAWLRDEIAAAYRRLGEQSGVSQPAVAVRSSALDEDGAAASFAGQHETYLNIVGPDAVAEAVARCWASLRSARAAEYRRQQGLRHADARIAVLVQQLVPADASAVVFSANPVSGRRDEVVINATWGLGESLVGGTVTPDTYVLRKPELTVVSRHIGDKLRMTIPALDGTREVDVPRLLRSRATLTEAQAREMARLAVDLEARMGHPVDVECAYHQDRLYLLQCRPITTL